MRADALLLLLEQVKAGQVSPRAASEELSSISVEDVGFARIDHHRALRTGMPEVIYCAGKTPEQVAEIFFRMARSGESVLATRASGEVWSAVQKVSPAALYSPVARFIGLKGSVALPPARTIAVVSAGTSDMPAAEEAALTAEHMGITVERVYDVGVAGLHRILSQQAVLRNVSTVIVCAGMEGALPSVVGGLVGVPVIAVPTSVGYGAAFGGVAALLGMLNSCSPNVTVVNIDNGFGAAYVATMIARSGIAAASESKADSEEMMHSIDS